MKTTSRRWAAAGAMAAALVVASAVQPAKASAAEAPENDTITLACQGVAERALTSGSGESAWRCPSLSTGAHLSVGTQVFELPPDGTAVTASAVVEAGGDHVADVTVATADGGVAVRIDEGPVLGTPAAAAVLVANVSDPSTAVHDSPTISPLADFSITCATVGQVTAYDGRWQSRDYRWWYNPTSEPNSGTTISLVSASDSMAGGESSLCGDWPNLANLTYIGRTYVDEPQVTSNGGCGTFSDVNAVGWGALSNLSTLAVACTWRRSGYIVKSDIKVDTSSRSWNTSNSCSGNRYDVQGVATHEFGHAIGVGHVFQESQQVMKPASSTCELDQRELGYGDQRNIVLAYGG